MTANAKTQKKQFNFTDPRLFNAAYAPLFDNKSRFLHLFGSAGSGKALAIDTPLPTPTGWTTMGAAKVGDYLLDENGKPCKVLKTSGVMVNRECFEVEFDDGNIIVADANHQWLTTDRLARSSEDNQGKKYSNGSKSHLPQCQPKYKPEIRTTKEISETLFDYRGHTNHSIPVVKGLHLPERDLPVDPFIFGAWLGDGTSRNASITIGEQDSVDMIANIEAAGHKVTLRKHSTVSFGMGANISHQVRGTHGKYVRNDDSLFAKLDSLNVIRNKHIPTIYLRASYSQRLSLLQGLMDTDGCINEVGSCEFCTVSETLATQFEELCLSLGLKVVCRKGTVKYKDEYRVRYRFSFTPYIQVFRLKRKVERIKSRGRQSARQFRRYIVAVKPCASVPVKCVEVDSPNHLFLAGKGMIPTHNSVFGCQKEIALSFKSERAGRKTLVVRKFFNTLKNSVFAQMKSIIYEWEFQKYFDFTTSPLGITNLETGVQFVFAGLDDVEKIKSIAGVDRILIEEATELTNKNELDQLSLRLRGFEEVQITLMYNPINVFHWLNTEIHQTRPEGHFIKKTTYKDNRFLDDEYKRTLENLKFTNPNYYKVYVLGEWGQNAEGLIYPDYETVAAMPAVQFYGLDFGYNDPTAMVAGAVSDNFNSNKKDYFVTELIYDTHLTSTMLIERLGSLDVSKQSVIIADSARPEMIADVRKAGYNIQPCAKYKGSVLDGINLVKNYNLKIVAGSKNLFKEITNYSWREKDGTFRDDEPNGAIDHLMDSFRYALESDKKRKGVGIFF